MTNDYYREEEHDFVKILETPKSELTLEEEAGYFDQELLSFLKSKGDVEQWEEICNTNGIFPTYLTDHLSPEEKI